MLSANSRLRKSNIYGFTGLSEEMAAISVIRAHTAIYGHKTFFELEKYP